jgi:hypothetical protein
MFLCFICFTLPPTPYIMGEFILWLVYISTVAGFHSLPWPPWLFTFVPLHASASASMSNWFSSNENHFSSRIVSSFSHRWYNQLHFCLVVWEPTPIFPTPIPLLSPSDGGNWDHQMLDSNVDNISMDALLGHNQGSRKKREGNHQCFLWISDLKVCVAIGIFVIYIYIIYLLYIYK